MNPENLTMEIENDPKALNLGNHTLLGKLLESASWSNFKTSFDFHYNVKSFAAL